MRFYLKVEEGVKKMNRARCWALCPLLVLFMIPKLIANCVSPRLAAQTALFRSPGNNLTSLFFIKIPPRRIYIVIRQVDYFSLLE